MLTVLPDKRSKILETAHKHFLRYGISKTTMRDLADILDMAVSNLYLYFQNKREIVLAIAEQCHQEREERLKIILADNTLQPGQKLESFLVDKFRCCQEFRCQSSHVKELIAYLIQEFPEKLPQWQQDLELAIQTILEQGEQLGNSQIDCSQKQSPKEAAQILRIATSQFFLPAYIEPPLPLDEQELVRLIHWFLWAYEQNRDNRIAL